MKDQELKDLLKSHFKDINNDYQINQEGFNRISKNLNAKKIIENRPQLFLKYRLAFVFIFVLLCLISLPLFFKDYFNFEKNNENNQDGLDIVVPSQDINYILYTAANRSLNNNFKKLGSTNTYKINSNYIEYPFDYVKITDPFKFEFSLPKDSGTFIEKQVGFGRIEVIIAYVSVYYDNTYLPWIEEYMVIFKGEQGIYCYLSYGNKYDSMNNIIEYGFTSHKTIEKNNIVKDKSYDSIFIFVSMLNNKPSLINFKNWQFSPDDDIFYAEESYSPIVDSYKSVNVSDVYKLVDLYEPKLVDIEVEITKIVEHDINGYIKNYLEIKPIEGRYLNHIELDENTKIIKADSNQGVFNDLKVGQIIKISYLNYFEGYNPNVVYAYEIFIINEINKGG